MFIASGSCNCKDEKNIGFKYRYEKAADSRSLLLIKDLIKRAGTTSGHRCHYFSTTEEG
jgi:hypothetical protein